MEPPAEDQIVLINDHIWAQLIQLTSGAAAQCFQCGVCTAICPWGLVRQEPLSVRSILRRTQLGLDSGNGGIWLCTACAQCEANCPRGVNVVEVFRGLRTIAWEQRRIARGLPSVLWSVYWNNNPWSQPPSRRADWAKHLEIPIFNPDQHEILLYIGCTPSYDRRAQRIACALVHLLQEAGVCFGYLGNDEPCCGEGVLSLGHKPFFEEIAAETTQVFLDRGVTQLVAISPHCFNVFNNHYPMLSAKLQAQHYTQYLANLIREQRLNFGTPLEACVTFQDPCLLGRYNHEYDAPRTILESIPGVELVEMNLSGEDGLCCGGGGGRMWFETPLGERFSDLRVQQAGYTGAALLATACPFCVVCLEDSAKALNMERLKVMDVAEIAALAHGK